MFQKNWVHTPLKNGCDVTAYFMLRTKTHAVVSSQKTRNFKKDVVEMLERCREALWANPGIGGHF